MTNNEQILPHVRLQFNVEHPQLDECWLEGFESANNNLPEQDNPFELNSKEYEYWCQGWWAGFYGEAPIFSRSTLETKQTAQIIDIRKVKAANQADWTGTGVKKWAGRVVKIAGAIAVTVAAIELIDMAV